MKIEVVANDHGAIYVFEVSGTQPAGLADKSDSALLAVFGPVLLNTNYVDVVYPATLMEMTLPQYILHGYDLTMSDEVADDLKNLANPTVLVMSAAFGRQEVALDLPQNTRLVTTLRKQSAIKVIDPITTKSADGVLTPKPAKPPKSNARMSGMVAMYALLAMFALVGLMIWVGG